MRLATAIAAGVIGPRRSGTPALPPVKSISFDGLTSKASADLGVGFGREVAGSVEFVYWLKAVRVAGDPPAVVVSDRGASGGGYGEMLTAACLAPIGAASTYARYYRDARGGSASNKTMPTTDSGGWSLGSAGIANNGTNLIAGVKVPVGENYASNMASGHTAGTAMRYLDLGFSWISGGLYGPCKIAAIAAFAGATSIADRNALFDPAADWNVVGRTLSRPMLRCWQMRHAYLDGGAVKVPESVLGVSPLIGVGVVMGDVSTGDVPTGHV